MEPKGIDPETEYFFEAPTGELVVFQKDGEYLY